MSEVSKISAGVIVPKDGIINPTEITENLETNKVINVWSDKNSEESFDSKVLSEHAILADIENMAGIPNDEPANIETIQKKPSILTSMMKFFSV